LRVSRGNRVRSLLAAAHASSGPTAVPHLGIPVGAWAVRGDAARHRLRRLVTLAFMLRLVRHNISAATRRDLWDVGRIIGAQVVMPLPLKRSTAHEPQLECDLAGLSGGFYCSVIISLTSAQKQKNKAPRASHSARAGANYDGELRSSPPANFPSPESPPSRT